MKFQDRSLSWNPELGVLEPTFIGNQPRNSAIEMAHLRNWRRGNEKKRREKFKQERTGYEGLGYASGADKWKVNYSVKRRRTEGGGLFDYGEPESREPTP